MEGSDWETPPARLPSAPDEASNARSVAPRGERARRLGRHGSLQRVLAGIHLRRRRGRRRHPRPRRGAEGGRDDTYLGGGSGDRRRARSRFDHRRRRAERRGRCERRRAGRFLRRARPGRRPSDAHRRNRGRERVRDRIRLPDSPRLRAKRQAILVFLRGRDARRDQNERLSGPRDLDERRSDRPHGRLRYRRRLLVQRRVHERGGR
jgi:hypothetical protein